MKKFLILIFTFILNFSFVNANSWPTTVEKYWTISFDSWSLLWKNVSVEKEVLLFRYLDESIKKYNPKLIWLDFLYKKWYEKKIIQDNLYNLREYSDIKCDQELCYFHNKTEKTLDKINSKNTKTLFLSVWGDSRSDEVFNNTWSIETVVEYTLKNNSNIEIKDQKVSFSPVSNLVLNYLQWYDFSNIDKAYYLYDENYYPQNLKFYLNWVNIPYSVNIFEYKKNINGDYDFWIGDLLPKENIILKNIYTLNLWFKPNETKKFRIIYKTPILQNFYRILGNIQYDFSPIFNWKDWIVKNLYIWLIWDKNHILNSSMSSSDWYLKFEEIKKDFYLAKAKNVTKSDKLESLNLFFNSNLSLIEWVCEMWQVYSNILCWNENNNYEGLYKYIDNLNSWSIQEILKWKDNYHVIIKFTDWKQKEYKIFDLLK